jgi:hypothetical protein
MIGLSSEPSVRESPFGEALVAEAARALEHTPMRLHTRDALQGSARQVPDEAAPDAGVMTPTVERRTVHFRLGGWPQRGTVELVPDAGVVGDARAALIRSVSVTVLPGAPDAEEGAVLLTRPTGPSEQSVYEVGDWLAFAQASARPGARRQCVEGLSCPMLRATWLNGAQVLVRVDYDVVDEEPAAPSVSSRRHPQRSSSLRNRTPPSWGHTGTHRNPSGGRR